jgi:hypothetical protein
MVGPVFDIANAAIGGSKPTEALTQIIKNSNNKLYTGLDISGPLAFGYADGGIGFGLFNNTKASMNAASISAVGLHVAEDLLLTGGYAFSIDLGKGNQLDIGVTGKGYVRGEVSVKKSVFDLEPLLSHYKRLFEDEPFSQTTGVGVDLGMRWSRDKSFAVGLACRDAFSPGYETTYTSAKDFLDDPTIAKTGGRNVVVSPDLAAGIMWKPALGRLGLVIDSLVFALDYVDILDLFDPIPRNAILNLGMGVEVKFLDIVYARLGIRDALLAAGVGLDLGVARLNVTAYGEELGLEPGARPVYNILLSFEFRY